MTLIAKELARNRIVARRFGARAADYDAHAELQEKVAGRLAALLPPLDAPSVLEVGCGTGFLTRHLLEKYPDGDFLITDLAPEMLDACKAREECRKAPKIRFTLMDGEAPDGGERFDLIALSMTLQWFADPLTGLKRLKALLNPGGRLVYACPGPENFPEWKGVLAGEGLPDGTLAMPHLPGVVREDTETITYKSGSAFLAAIKAIGAGEPRSGYRPLSPGKLRRALGRLERDHGARVTWHMVYGRVSKNA